jgi:hypothetical protein
LEPELSGLQRFDQIHLMVQTDDCLVHLNSPAPTRFFRGEGKEFRPESFGGEKDTANFSRRAAKGLFEIVVVGK